MLISCSVILFWDSAGEALRDSVCLLYEALRGFIFCLKLAVVAPLFRLANNRKPDEGQRPCTWSR